MLSRVALTLCVCAVWSCGGSSGPTSDPGPGGSSGPTSDPGPLVDNTQWAQTTDGDEILGAPPGDAECDTTPMGCPEYPWPDDECVTFEEDSSCVVAYVPECFPPDYTVLAVYTRMPDDRVSLCNWLTLEQPSLRPIRASDQVEIRTYHSTLTAPESGVARMSFVVGNELAFDEHIEINPIDGSQFLSTIWTAPKDYPVGTSLLWHVDNHGRNEYLLIEVNIL